MEKQHAVCFSGYRSSKFTFPLTGEHPKYIQLLNEIRQTILDSIYEDYDNFFIGMADGFDLLSASIFYELKDAGQIPENIRFTAVLPFAEHRPALSWLEIHQTVLKEADEVITIAANYSSQAFLARNRFMVDHSTRLISYYTGLTGGTAYTVKYAEKKGLQIINLAESL